MSASRAFWDAIDSAKRKRRQAEQADVAGLDCDDREDDRLDDEGDELGGGVRLAPVMPPATALRQHVGTSLLGVHDYENGVVLELAPVGHMGRRWVLIEGITNVTDITFRDDAARPDDEQAQIDIGDDMYERERYADHDIDMTGTEKDPRPRRW